MKNPAFLFYTSDFITGTLFMNNEEVGAYIRVLCMQHQKGHLTEEEIKNICKKNKIFLSVISHFKQDKKGLFYNKRLDREKDKREKYSESRAKNRKKRTEDKINISSTYENISKTYDAHMENENEDENINNNNININTNYNIKNITKDYIFSLYTNTINSNISSIELEKLDNYINIFKDDLRIIAYAIEYCKMYRAYNINYLCKILNNWYKAGFNTLEQIKEKERPKSSKNNNSEEEKVELFDYDWLSDVNEEK